jgi:hypothetical protein
MDSYEEINKLRTKQMKCGKYYKLHGIENDEIYKCGICGTSLSGKKEPEGFFYAEKLDHLEEVHQLRMKIDSVGWQCMRCPTTKEMLRDAMKHVKTNHGRDKHKATMHEVDKLESVIKDYTLRCYKKFKTMCEVKNILNDIIGEIELS